MPNILINQYTNTQGDAMSQSLIDLSHTVADGLITYKGLPAPMICDFLSREDSRSHYADGTEFHIGKIEMVSNTGTYVDAPFHRYADGQDLSELPLTSLANLETVMVRVPDGYGRFIHPDLLKDFILFLPEDYREKARKHFDRVAKQSSENATSCSQFGTCVICMDRPRSHVFAPCGHLCVCDLCTSRSLLRFGRCPVCYQKSSKAVQVFLP